MSEVANLPAWFDEPLAVVDRRAAERAASRQAALTKPAGSLGMLETIAIRLAGLQARDRPSIERPAIVVFAADHGVAAESVSAFPQSVTIEMVRNFSRGGAAVCVLARHLNASLEVVNVGTARRIEPLPGVVDARVAAGTSNFVVEPAMTHEQLAAAVSAGRDAVERARAAGADIFIGGDMGIANTTAAAAIACALTGVSAVELAGPGTGLDAAGVDRKRAVVSRALERHAIEGWSPVDVMRCLGGLEIAALAGAFVRCGTAGLPILVDGFISSVAALAAVHLRPGLADWMFLGHVCAEPGHRHVIRALDLTPVLDLGMRLGEGSGAAAACELLRMACEVHNGMATFDEAGVSGSLDG